MSYRCVTILHWWPLNPCPIWRQSPEICRLPGQHPAKVYPGPGSVIREDAGDLQKVQKIQKIVFLGNRNFRKKVRKPKLQSQKMFCQTNKLCGNQMKSVLSFVITFTARFPQSQEFLKYPEICGNKHISTLFCCVYVGKFPHSIKSFPNGIHAICHYLQVWMQEEAVGTVGT